MKTITDWNMWRIVKLLVLISLAPSVYPNLNEDVDSCLVSNEMFTKREKKYVDKRVHSEADPSLAGPEVEEFQKKVYAKEIRQRLFECISNRTYGISTVLTELNPKYRTLAQSCREKQPQPICNPSYKYRSIDGTCNNLMFPRWGSMFSCLRRFLPQRYEGVSGFRQSVCGRPLPEPRTISLKIYVDQNRPTKDISHMAIFFGQFVAHDMSDVSTTFVSTKPIDCCSNPGKKQHPQCAPILISRTDPFYAKHNVTCFNFVRAAACDNCDIGKRNHINQATSYIDLSPVYGLDDKHAKSLRLEDGKGKLKFQYNNDEELLPPNPNSGVPGGCGHNHENCFLGGDRRANMHTPLMTLHTLFLREHNRIAEELSKLNTFWDDEKLYQEARRINIAQMQVITYKEYLQLVLGPKLMALFGLHITVPSVYMPILDTTIWAEFNGAAYRLHSALSGIVAEYGSEADERYLKNSFFNAETLYKGDMSSLMIGMCQSPAQLNDRAVAKDMTDYMYKQPKASWGFDVNAVNIQRGRDLGLPTYIEMVRFWTLGLVDIQTFEQLDMYMDEKNIEVLKEIYCDVRDIDLWVGLNNERTEENMFVGLTAGKIIGFQFFALMNGDRFFFNHMGNFNYAQLATLKQASFARIMCDNTGIDSIQKHALRISSFSNPIINCTEIPKVNLGYWAEAGS